jgi:hypothetical protein
MSKIENIYQHPNYLSLDDFEGEIWKQVADMRHPYFVSNLGRAKTTWSASTRWGSPQRPPKILKVRNCRGYLKIKLDGVMRFTHRIVAAAFIGPSPSPIHAINHKDGIKWNNRPENLEWVTPSENSRHSFALGLQKAVRGVGMIQSIQISQQNRDGSIIAVHGGIKEAARAIGKNHVSIGRAVKGTCKQAHGFTWKRITKEEYFRLKKQLAPKEV